MFFSYNNRFISDKRLMQFFGISLCGSVLFASFVYLNILYTPLDTKKIDTVKDKTPTEQYVEKYKTQFHNSFKEDKFNQNIEPEFYDNKQYNQIVESNNNSLEKYWKQRILFENTPCGNVIMFYDAYKLSFTYYADKNIPYTILNAVAMKYVLTFFCRDFFLDKSLIPSNHTTPFLHVHEIDKKESVKKKIDVNKGPFAKFKNYTKKEEQAKQTKQNKTVNTEDKQTVKNYIKNKFVSLGKIYNYSVLKNIRCNKSKCKEIVPLDYDSFKKWHKPQQFKMMTDTDYTEEEAVSF